MRRLRPDVTYGRGALLHKRRLPLSCAIRDEYIAFVTGGVDDLLSVMD